MANQVSYEIYTRAAGRWVLDSRYGPNERERAIDEGKKLSKQPGVDAVKVVRETCDEDANPIKESTVYNSAKENEDKSTGKGGGRVAGASFSIGSWVL
ncbi:MAG: hypothetical protein EXQ91_07135 [Alphaproteobacteria bacterium]|nr:hypothetical protein [Alphaproteobacteria bacterium]